MPVHTLDVGNDELKLILQDWFLARHAEIASLGEIKVILNFRDYGEPEDVWAQIEVIER